MPMPAGNALLPAKSPQNSPKDGAPGSSFTKGFICSPKGQVQKKAHAHPHWLVLQENALDPPPAGCPVQPRCRAPPPLGQPLQQATEALAVTFPPTEPHRNGFFEPSLRPASPLPAGDGHRTEKGWSPYGHGLTQTLPGSQQPDARTEGQKGKETEPGAPSWCVEGPAREARRAGSDGLGLRRVA